jgi:hypothetical protein
MPNPVTTLVEQLVHRSLGNEVGLGPAQRKQASDRLVRRPRRAHVAGA